MTDNNYMLPLLEKHLTKSQIQTLFARIQFSEENKQAIYKSLSSSVMIQADQFASTSKRIIFFLVIAFLGLMVIGGLRAFLAIKIPAFIAMAAAYWYWRSRKHLDEHAPASQPVPRVQRPRGNELSELKQRIGKGGYNRAMFSAQTLDIDALKDEIQKDSSALSQTDNKGYSLLCFALNADFIDGIKYLIEQGAPVDFAEGEEQRSLLKQVKSEEALGILLHAKEAQTAPASIS